MKNELDNYIGQFATKKRGFFSGLIGIIEKNESGLGRCKHALVFKDGSKVGISKLDDIELCDGEIGGIYE